MADPQEEKDRRRIEAYEKELAADPRSLAFVALAEAHNRLGAWDLAVGIARRGLALHSGSVAGHLALAVAEAGRGRIREALEAIKAALIIDQENPRALALMGSLLLQKGLAHRATQFLTQAVRLAPDSREYGDLLKRAKRIAKTEKPLELPSLRGSQVQEAKSPWAGAEGNESTEYLASEEQRTVFATDLEGAPLSDADPTMFAERVPVAGTEGGFDAKPKVGGSAAEYSQMMKRLGGTEAPAPEEQATVASVDRAALDPKNELGRPAAVPEAHGSEDKKTVFGKGADGAKVESAPKAAGSAPKAAGSGPKGAGSAPKSAELVAEKPAKADKPVKAAKPEPRPIEPPRPSEERPATMLVDESIWAIYGGAPPGKEDADAAQVVEEKPRAQRSTPDDGEEGAAERPAGAMVVRTSAGVGRLAFWTLVLVLSGAATWTGYSFALGRAGADVSNMSEELRGLASDLERGGLASLRAAEEAIGALRQSSPELDDLLAGVLADVHAEIWSSFGGDPTRRLRAQEALASLAERKPTVEMLSAGVTLSAATGTTAMGGDSLENALARFSDSPKAWLLRSRLATAQGAHAEAQQALLTAYALNPRRRGTLLELARWHARQGAPAAAIRFFDELQELEPNDIEALLHRYVLGKLSGVDPAANDIAGRLAGLVREESKAVAKDETGRAALVFAVTDLVRGDLDAGLDRLGLAANAYPTSPEYRRVVGALFLVLGERALAKLHLEASMKLEASDETRLWLARLGYAERAKLRRPSDAGPRLLERQEAKKSTFEAELDFGRVRLRPDRFTLIEVEASPAVFPEADYRARSARASGEALERGLEVANLLRLSRRARDPSEAQALLEDARKLADGPDIEVALGRLLLEAKDLEPAKKAFRAALVFDDKDPAARIGLAEVLAAQGEAVAALDTLEPLVQSNVVAPRAYRLIARIKTERGDHKGALELLERAASLSGGASVSMLVELGRLRHKAGDGTKALEAYERALAAEPSLETPPPKGGDGRKPLDLYYTGQVLASKSDWARAGEMFQRAMTKEETLPVDLSFHLGRALIRSKKTRKQGKKALESYLRNGQDAALKEEASRLLKSR
jgi:tetratricopeptide (TPR) repeat protein